MHPSLGASIRETLGQEIASCLRNLAVVGGLLVYANGHDVICKIEECLPKRGRPE